MGNISFKVMRRETEMPEPAGFRVRGPGGRIGKREQFDLRTTGQREVELVGLAFGAMSFGDDFQAEDLGVELFRAGVIGGDDGDVVETGEVHAEVVNESAEDGEDVSALAKRSGVSETKHMERDALPLDRRLRQEILFARERVYRFGKPTPLERLVLPGPGPEIWVKREDLSAIKAYKWRGACNRMAVLTPEEGARGVVTASAGNHAQGVALAARQLGIDARTTCRAPRHG